MSRSDISWGVVQPHARTLAPEGQSEGVAHGRRIPPSRLLTRHLLAQHDTLFLLHPGDRGTWDEMAAAGAEAARAVADVIDAGLAQIRPEIRPVMTTTALPLLEAPGRGELQGHVGYPGPRLARRLWAEEMLTRLAQRADVSLRPVLAGLAKTVG